MIVLSYTIAFDSHQNKNTRISYTIDFDIVHIEIKILDNLHNRLWYSNGKTIPIKLVLISLLKLHLLWQKK